MTGRTLSADCRNFWEWYFYNFQVASIYMSTRLVVNISQVLIPLYLHRTLGLPTRSLALVPYSMYLGSLAAAGAQRCAPRSLTRKLNYFIGSACAMAGFVWIFVGSDSNYKVYFIYLVAVLIGKYFKFSRPRPRWRRDNCSVETNSWRTKFTGLTSRGACATLSPYQCEVERK